MKKFDNLVVLSLQSPSKKENQNQFPRRGGTAWMVAKKNELTHKYPLEMEYIDEQSDKVGIKAQSTERSKIYIIGHGSNTNPTIIAGTDSNENNLIWDVMRLGDLIASTYKPNAKATAKLNQPHLVISLVACYSGQGGLESLAGKLVDYLYTKHGIAADVYGRVGGTSRYDGKALQKRVEGLYHRDGSKILITRDVTGKKMVLPVEYSSAQERRLLAELTGVNADRWESQLDERGEKHLHSPMIVDKSELEELQVRINKIHPLPISIIVDSNNPRYYRLSTPLIPITNHLKKANQWVQQQVAEDEITESDAEIQQFIADISKSSTVEWLVGESQVTTFATLDKKQLAKKLQLLQVNYPNIGAEIVSHIDLSGKTVYRIVIPFINVQNHVCLYKQQQIQQIKAMISHFQNSNFCFRCAEQNRELKFLVEQFNSELKNFSQLSYWQVLALTESVKTRIEKFSMEVLFSYLVDLDYDNSFLSGVNCYLNRSKLDKGEGFKNIKKLALKVSTATRGHKKRSGEFLQEVTLSLSQHQNKIKALYFLLVIIRSFLLNTQELAAKKEIKDIDKSELVKAVVENLEKIFSINTPAKQMIERLPIIIASIATSLDKITSSLTKLNSVEQFNLIMMTELLKLPMRKEFEFLSHKDKIDHALLLVKKLLLAATTEDYVEILKKIKSGIELSRTKGKMEESLDLEKYLTKLRERILMNIVLATDNIITFSFEQKQAILSLVCNERDISANAIDLIVSMSSPQNPMITETLNYLKYILEPPAEVNKQKIDLGKYIYEHSEKIVAAINRLYNFYSTNKIPAQGYLHKYAFLTNSHIIQYCRNNPTYILKHYIEPGRINFDVLQDPQMKVPGEWSEQLQQGQVAMTKAISEIKELQKQYLHKSKFSFNISQRVLKKITAETGFSGNLPDALLNIQKKLEQKLLFGEDYRMLNKLGETLATNSLDSIAAEFVLTKSKVFQLPINKILEQGKPSNREKYNLQISSDYLLFIQTLLTKFQDVLPTSWRSVGQKYVIADMDFPSSNIGRSNVWSANHYENIIVSAVPQTREKRFRLNEFSAFYQMILQEKPLQILTINNHPGTYLDYTNPGKYGKYEVTADVVSDQEGMQVGQRVTISDGESTHTFYVSNIKTEGAAFLNLNYSGMQTLLDIRANISHGNPLLIQDVFKDHGAAIRLILELLNKVDLEKQFQEKIDGIFKTGNINSALALDLVDTIGDTVNRLRKVRPAFLESGQVLNAFKQFILVRAVQLGYDKNYVDNLAEQLGVGKQYTKFSLGIAEGADLTSVHELPWPKDVNPNTIRSNFIGNMTSALIATDQTMKEKPADNPLFDFK